MQSNIELLKKPLPPHSKPWVSIVILNYNGGSYIEKCIESVLESDYPSFEVIVVDNASDDGSMELTLPYKDKIATIINPKNYFFAKGCNQGIKIARGEIIVLLNIDTKVRSNWLSELVKPLIEEPDVAITGSKLLYGDEIHIQHAGGEVNPIGLSRHFGYEEEDKSQWDKPMDVGYVTGASFAFKKSFLDQLEGKLDELFPLYFDDTDLCWHAHRLGYKVRYVPDSVAIHYESFGTTRFSYRFLYHFHQGRWRYLLKNYPWKSLFTAILKEEWKWFWGAGRFGGEWRPILHAYLTIPFILPLIIQRRILRKLKEK